MKLMNQCTVGFFSGSKHVKTFEVKKRESNRLAAQRHRRRQADYLRSLRDEIETLEKSIQNLTQENDMLRSDLQILNIDFTYMTGFEPLKSRDFST